MAKRLKNYEMGAGMLCRYKVQIILVLAFMVMTFTIALLSISTNSFPLSLAYQNIQSSSLQSIISNLMLIRLAQQNIIDGIEPSFRDDVKKQLQSYELAHNKGLPDFQLPDGLGYRDQIKDLVVSQTYQVLALSDTVLLQEQTFLQSIIDKGAQLISLIRQQNDRSLSKQTSKDVLYFGLFAAGIVLLVVMLGLNLRWIRLL